MVRVAELLADLTLLKTISSTDALTLLSPTPITSTTTAATPAPDDPDLTRAEEFLTLRAEQVGKDELRKKREAVEKVMREREERKRQLKDKEEGWHEDGPTAGGGFGAEEGRRMAGAWGR